MAQSVEHPTLVSGHDLTVHEFKPCTRLTAISKEPASDPLSLPCCLCPTPVHTLALSKINIKKKKLKATFKVKAKNINIFNSSQEKNDNPLYQVLSATKRVKLSPLGPFTSEKNIQEEAIKQGEKEGCRKGRYSGDLKVQGGKRKLNS